MQPWQVPLRLLQVGSIALPLIVGIIWGLQSWKATKDGHVAAARRQVELALFEYINGFYNPRRRHSTLGGKSPLAFERVAA